MKKTMTTLSDVFTLFQKGIWGYIRDVADTNDFKTWLTSQKAEDLDISFLSDYGDRPISKLVENLLSDGELSTASNTMLARYVYNRFINNWLHKLNIEQSEYELFKPYDITTNTVEEIDKTLTKTGTVREVNDVDNTGTDNRSIGINESSQLSGKDTVDNTGTQTKNDTGTQTVNDTGTQTIANTGTQSNSLTGSDTTNTDVTNDNNVFGFNTTAQNGVPQSKQVTDSDVTSSKTESNTRTDNLQAQRTDALQSQRTDALQSQRTDNLKSETSYGRTDTRTGANTDNRTLNLNETGEKTTTNNLSDRDLGTVETTTTRQGNIGNILYQDILEKENNFWNDFNFTEAIFKDVISIVTLPIYQIDI